MTDNVNEEEIEDFIQNNEEKEIRQIIQISEEQKHFSWNDFDDLITPYTWGNAIQKRVLEPVNSRQYEMINRDYIKNKLDNSIKDKTENETPAQETNETRDEDDSQLNNLEQNNEDTQKEENSQTDKLEKEDSTDEKEDSTDEKDEELPEINPQNSYWSKYEKGVTLITIASIMGFSVEFIRNIIYSILNPPLSLLSEFLPFYIVILILAFATSAWSMYIREIYLDSSIKTDYKKHIHSLRGEGSFYQVAEDATIEEEEEFINIQQALVKEQVKPIVFSLAITIPILVWMYTLSSIVGVGENIIFPLIGETTYSGFVIMVLQAYIFWYILVSIVSSQILKRLFILIKH